MEYGYLAILMFIVTYVTYVVTAVNSRSSSFDGDVNVMRTT